MDKKILGKQYERELRENASATEKQFKRLLSSMKRKYKLKCKVNFQKGWYKDDAFYISDFYFPQTKCTVELDGTSHDKKSQQIQDQRKEAYLSSIGIRTVRIVNRAIWTLDVDQLFQLLLRNRII